MVDIINDRRRDLRVTLRSYSNLTTADGACTAHLLNISETGALVAIIEPHQLAAGEAVNLEIDLPGGDSLLMEGHIAHVREHLLGLDCAPATEADATKIQCLVDQLTATSHEAE